jgi:hypothetical protein
MNDNYTSQQMACLEIFKTLIPTPSVMRKWKKTWKDNGFNIPAYGTLSTINRYCRYADIPDLFKQVTVTDGVVNVCFYKSEHYIFAKLSLH